MITPTQIRMARAALRLTAAELATGAKLHANTVQIAEGPGVSLGSHAVLQLYFEQSGITFVENGVLYLQSPEESTNA